MSKIYRSTQRTLIWLGDEDEDTEIVLPELKFISEEVFPDMIDTSGPGFLGQLFEGVDPDRTMENAGVSDFQGFVDFFSRVWFSRIWVLQECTLAPRCTCKCGRWELDWSHVTRAAACLGRTYGYLRLSNDPKIANNAAVIPVMVGLNPESFRQGSERLASLYTLCHSMKSTDPRDMFYAVHGMTRVSTLSPSQQTLAGVDVDYRRPVFEVLRNATRFTFLEREGIDLLHQVGPQFIDANPAIETQLPSWVPEWSIQEKNPRQIPAYHPLDTWHETNHTIDIDLIAADIGTNRLVLKGFVVDHVSRLLRPVLDFDTQPDVNDISVILRENISEIRSFFLACRDLVRESGNMLLAKEMLMSMALNDGLSRLIEARLEFSESAWTMLMDLFVDSTYLEAAAAFDTVSLDSYLDTDKTDMPVDVLEKSVEFCRRLISNCLGRRLFATHGGRFGICSRHTEVGDEVVAFLGSRMPFILRLNSFMFQMPEWASPQAMDDAQFKEHRFLGTCWMHSFIKNNEMQGLVDSGEGLKNFDIW